MDLGCEASGELLKVDPADQSAEFRALDALCPREQK